MIKAIVAYDTKFGNTEKIANALAEGMKDLGVEVDCVKVGEVEIDKLARYDLLVIGGPTHKRNISKPVNEFLEEMETVEIKAMNAFAFDTRVKRLFAGSAGKRIEKKLESLGMNVVRPYSSALIKAREGPLEEDMEEMFKHISAELVKSMQQ